MPKPTAKTARRRRLLAFAAISLVVALVAALASVCRIGLLPPSVQTRDLQTGAAVTHILVDLPTDERRHLTYPEFEAMTKRSSLVGHLLASPPVLERIAAQMEIDA